MQRKDILTLLLNSFVWLCCSLTFLFLLWNILFGIWMGFVLMIPFVFLLHSVRDQNWRTFSLIYIGSVAVYLAALPLSFLQYDTTSRRMMSELERGQQLDVFDKAGIYGMNIIMGCGAYILYPEVAKETLLMCFPDEDGVRTYNDDFFLLSEKIRKVPIPAQRKKVAWSADVYSIMKDESRVALALNSCYVTTQKQGDKISYEVEVGITYPESSRVPVLLWPVALYIEEGLIHYLETCGWLFPYKAVYKATISVDEWKKIQTGGKSE